MFRPFKLWHDFTVFPSSICHDFSGRQYPCEAPQVVPGRSTLWSEAETRATVVLLALAYLKNMSINGFAATFEYSDELILSILD